MRVNPEVKKALVTISKGSIDNSNTEDKDRRYHRKLLRIFKNNLSEEEQLYVLKSLLEYVHYRSITTDEDNLMILHNIKLRTYFFFFFVGASTMILIALLFGDHHGIDNTVDILTNIFKLISI